MAIDNKDKKVLKSSIEREQNEVACSAECEKIKGSKNLNVPPLRFPEFTEEWRSHFLTDFMSFKNGMNPDAKRFGRGTKFISVMDILNNQFICYDNIRASVEVMDGDIDTYGVNYGDILFQRSSETLEDVGQANVYLDSKPAIFGGFVIRGKSKGNYNPLFFRYLLASPTARKRIIVKGAGAQHFNIGQDGLSKVSLDIPCMQEQKKIGELLQCIDARIATQNKIIEDLKKLKCAIIEKLYSKIQGKEYSYGQLFDVVNERNKQMEYSNILSASQEKGMVNRDDLNLDIQFERSNINTYKIVRKGDYVIHLRSFQGGFAFSDKLGVCSPAYTILRPNSLLEYSYLSYYFTSRRFIKSLIIVTYGIRDGRSINVEEWLNMKVVIPSKEHQLHTLNVLKRIDDKVENEEKYATCLSNQKQYLLRQMFI
jgi:type I restriction enzyme S subunit